MARRNMGTCIFVYGLCTPYGDFCDVLVSAGLEELLHAIINDGLVAFRIGNFLDLTCDDIYF